MKRKAALSILQQVEGFPNPDIAMEQYMTPPDIALDILSIANVQDKHVIDLGCGTGMLSMAAILSGASFVTSVDMDPKALEVCKENMQAQQVEAWTSILSDVTQFEGTGDVCVSNPPFGTRNAGIDKAFITKGLECCPVMYSLHKSSTRKHLVSYFTSLGIKCEPLAQIQYNLDKSFHFHKKGSKLIEVDLIRFTRLGGDDVQRMVE